MCLGSHPCSQVDGNIDSKPPENGAGVKKTPSRETSLKPTRFASKSIGEHSPTMTLVEKPGSSHFEENIL